MTLPDGDIAADAPDRPLICTNIFLEVTSNNTIRLYPNNESSSPSV
jgi:hypothetical protein